MSYVIEKNVPLQPDGRGGRIYPFKDMEVGDSFEADHAHTIVRAAHGYALRAGKKFATRKNGQRVRIWRIA